MKNHEIYFEWDVHNWSKVLPLWEEALTHKQYSNAIELGSRNGGLSLWLAQNYNLKVSCTDMNSPSSLANQLHKAYPLKGTITYHAIDITKIDFPDNSFDIVIFKSVLGALSTYQNQIIAINEIFRILKPGGVLLFAENLRSSILHRMARRMFVKWARYWRYVSIEEMTTMLKIFNDYKIKTAGFSVILLPRWIKKAGWIIDDFLDRRNLLPGMKYIAMGYGFK